jgi:SAM-dependent methyltransferase
MARILAAPRRPVAHRRAGAQHARRGTCVMAFKDHFSRLAEGYRRYRPGYPATLIEYVAAAAPARGLAVDCATGSGQAAVALAGHFTAVLAVDASSQQLAEAPRCARVHYAVALAERLPLRERSVHLVAAAQAAHWFDFERFNAECRRVLVPGGVVAAWTYERFRAGPDLDPLIDRWYLDAIGPYWPPERRHVEQGYRSLPFPWRESPTPAFELETDWDLDTLLGYLGTWSAVQRCRERTGTDPLAPLRPALAAHWPEGGFRRLRWPIHLRLGRA